MRVLGVVLLSALMSNLSYAGAIHVRPHSEPEGNAIWAFPPDQVSASIVYLGDATGITGAEFRVEGLPTGWFVSATATSQIALGLPFGDGTNIAFDGCQSGQAIELFDVVITPTSTVTNKLLYVSSKSGAPPGFRCPLVTLCDAPVFTKVCVRGLVTCINPELLPCSMAVDDRTWGAVKTLYR